MTFSRTVCALALLSSLGTYSISASANEANGETIYPYVLFSGVDFVKNASEGYVGGMVSLNGDLDTDGFLMRVLGTRGWFEYDRSIPQADADYWQADVMVGYQIIRNAVTYTGYVGVEYQEYDLSPDDPTAQLRGDEFGFKAAWDIETERYFKRPFYAAVRGSYSTSFDTYYTIARLGLNVDRFAIGPEAWVMGDASGDASRVGGFVLTDLSLGGSSIGTLSVSGGYQFVDNADHPTGDNFGEEGAYGTVKFTMAFGE